ncbi:hypothetical protein GS575_09335 [Rhodococcus hoagii]|nr:hypothetical protein [Prescottella equi]
MDDAARLVLRDRCGLDVRRDRLGCAMTDPIERIRYDDPDAPALFPTPVDAADQAYERARDERIEAFE